MALTSWTTFLVVLSPAASKSYVVTKEIAVAAGEWKPTIPILYRDCKIPCLLRRVQYLDFRSAQEYASSLEQLISALENRTPLPDVAHKDLQAFLIGTTWHKRNSEEYLRFERDSIALWGIRDFPGQPEELAYYVTTASHRMRICWPDSFETDCVFTEERDRFLELENRKEGVWSLSATPRGA